ncbi:MAG TPA: tetratricopeptide repeat protein [Terriglobia bacterium]|nr:tetratricopeptide repeat protein [Terriglobia bacterium]
MLYLLVLLIAAPLGQNLGGFDAARIEIINTGKFTPYVATDIEAGPVTGNILNFHYFPGLNFYNGGRYKEAEEQFTYVIVRPHFLEANPRRAEFMSISYFLRGMIYFYHANGVGRHSMAKADFESALKWNPRNYIVLLELSRLYSGLGFQQQAGAVLRHLLDLKPDEETARQAQTELDKIQQRN